MQLGVSSQPTTNLNKVVFTDLPTAEAVDLEQTIPERGQRLD